MGRPPPACLSVFSPYMQPPQPCRALLAHGSLLLAQTDQFCAPLLQGLCQEAAAADRHEGHPEELCRLPEAEKLAVVETLHQSRSPDLWEEHPGP